MTTEPARRRWTIAVGGLLAAGSFAGCLNGSKDADTSTVLQRRYGGDVQCMRPIVEAQSQATQQQLAQIAAEGFGGSWVESDTLHAFAALTRQCGMMNG